MADKTATWAELKPQDGDLVLHCGHLESKPHHFWNTPKGIYFNRPDGSSGKATWVVSCPDCYQAAEGNAKRVKIRGDGLWMWDEPQEG